MRTLIKEEDGQMNTNIEIKMFESLRNDLPSANYPENCTLNLQAGDSKTPTDN